MMAEIRRVKWEHSLEGFEHNFQQAQTYPIKDKELDIKDKPTKLIII